MGCGPSRAEALSSQTTALLHRYHLTPSHIQKPYALFLKIHAKANRSKTPLQLKLSGNPLVVHPHELRAVFAIPHSILSDHLLDLIEGKGVGGGGSGGGGEEISFPEFLELVTVVSLLSREQLLSFGYHSFPVNDADELSIVSPLTQPSPPVSLRHPPASSPPAAHAHG